MKIKALVKHQLEAFAEMLEVSASSNQLIHAEIVV